MVLKMRQINKPPPLESKLEGAWVEEEELEEKNVPLTKSMAHEGEDYTKEKMEYLKLIKPLFEEISKDMIQNMVEMTQKIEKVFELMASQMGSKGIIGDSGSSQSVEKKTKVLFRNKHPYNLGSGVINVHLKLADNHI